MIKHCPFFVFLLLLFVALQMQGQEQYTPFGPQRVTTVALLQDARNKLLHSTDSAHILYQLALAQSRVEKNDDAIARSLIGLAICLNKKGQYNKSRRLFYEALPYALQSPLKDEVLANLYNSLGNLNLNEDHLDSALIFYYRSLYYLKRNPKIDSSFLMITYANLGSQLAQLQQEDKSERALYYLNKAAQLATLLHNDQIIPQNYLNIGFLYDRVKGQPLVARQYYDSALAKFKMRQEQKSVSSIYYHIGLSYGRQGILDSAGIYLDSARTADRPASTIDPAILKALGDVYMKSGRYGQAIGLYEQVMSIDSNITATHMEALYTLALSYRALNKNATAFDILKKFIDLKDSSLRSHNIKDLNQLEVKHRTLEKDSELAYKQLIIVKQESKLKQKNTWMLFVIVCAGLISVLIFFIFKSYHKKQQLAMLQLKQNGLIALMRAEEQERERIARELHDGIGSLISSAKMHLRHDGQKNRDIATYENGLQLLDEAYDELRLTAHNLVPLHLLEQGLLYAIEAYCQRVSKPSEFVADCVLFGDEPVLPQEQALSVYRTIQELMHNARKHGKASEVFIFVNNHDYLSISVEDNGSGLQEAYTGEGSGLWNIKNRLELWGGKIEMDNRPGMGMTVYVTF